MNKCNKKGKYLFICSIIVFMGSLYSSLNGFHDNKLTGASWFILVGALFMSVVNLFKNVKEGTTYNYIANVVISFTVLFCYIIPQLILY